MKKLVLIFLLFSFVLKSQAVYAPYGSTKIGFINVIHESPDYNKHYAISFLMSGFFISSMYYVTDRIGLSILSGASTSFVVGIIGKEYIHDKFMKLGMFSRKDIEADVLGTVGGTYVASIGLLVYNKRQNELEIDTAKYNFNNVPVKIFLDE